MNVNRYLKVYGAVKQRKNLKELKVFVSEEQESEREAWQGIVVTVMVFIVLILQTINMC